jgi:hypothetical protein
VEQHTAGVKVRINSGQLVEDVYQIREIVEIVATLGIQYTRT